jgi:hypothetical protein
MRRQLLLTIAAATLGIAVAAATVNAQGDLLGSGQDGVSINLPGGSDLPDLTLEDCPVIEDGKLRAELGCPELPGDSGSGGDTGGGDTGGGDTGGGDTGGGDTGGGDTGGGDTGGGGGATGEGRGDGATGPGGKGGRGSGAKGGQARDDSKPKRGGKGKKGKGDRKPEKKGAIRTPDGRPTRSNPNLTIAEFGPAPMGVPNFIIDRFSIPPFLLPIYQACGTQYGIPWQVLASINRIETNFGQNLNVSYAGAVGWMQFMPATWKAYGVDANGDGRKDPYNPYDAICSAARYLRASGWENNPRGAVFAYNRADWYVDEVLLYARQYGRLPDDLVGSLTGLTEGARFPVAATARYADDISERRAAKRAKPSKRATGNAADVISSSPTRRGINIFSRDGAPVVAVNDGVITKVGKSKRLGRHVVLRDSYGNRFTYAQLGRVADVYPVPKRTRLRARDFKLVRPGDDPKPTRPASAGGGNRSTGDAATNGGPINTEDVRERLYAYPERPRIAGRADLTGQLDALFAQRFPGYEGFRAYFSSILRFDRQTMQMRKLRKGSRVIAGTVLGRVGKTTDELAPHVHFKIRPAGRGAPLIDPKVILDGWKLLEATAIYRAAGENPFTGSATTSQVLLMSKPQLIRRVLADPRLEIYACGRDDIRTGQINRRVLAALAYLSERGFRQTVTSLRCGRSSSYTSSGNVSHHASGNAVDVARLNGLPVLGNQGRGSVTEAYVRDLMRLQGAMAPDQIISLMNFGANTFAMGDHADHVHIGYRPIPGEDGVSGHGTRRELSAVLEPDQWQRLMARLTELENPSVRTAPSRFALPSRKGKGKRGQGRRGQYRASNAHVGE